MKGIEFAGQYSFFNNQYNTSVFDKVFIRNALNFKTEPIIEKSKRNPTIEVKGAFSFPGVIIYNEFSFDRTDGLYRNQELSVIEPNIWSSWSNIDRQKLTSEYSHLLTKLINNVVTYKPEPSEMIESKTITLAKTLEPNASNIIPFIFNLSQNHKKLFNHLEKSFKECVGSLTEVSFPVDPEESGKLKLKFFDQNDIGYWAEEVSEGVLYFLALLCIIYQPNPPKLLLLEEPEKGIHPRRIKEVMNFIFDLARLRDIQIILTSHSPYVVDHFAEIPECISVFDRVDGETVIHNASDIIRKTNEEYIAQGLPPIKYTDSLGEYWVSGFLGGVPL